MTGRTAYLQSRILSADPIELIAILYEHAILAVREARERLAAKDIAGRARCISKAIAIIGELDSSLDHSTGGQMARDLARLYQYIRERLTAANMKKEDAPLGEVESLLDTLANSWENVKRAKQEIPAVSRPHDKASGAAMDKPEPTAAPRSFIPFQQDAEFVSSSHSWTA